MTATASRRATARAWPLLILLALAGGKVQADAGWFESGDTSLRIDLQLLNDAEVIRLPISQWPLPRASVEYALAKAREHYVLNAAVAAALARVRARMAPSPGKFTLDADVRGGRAGLWRDFDTLAREDAELGGRAGYAGGNFAAGISVTAVADPDDGQEIRLDGSHATLKLGNWLVSANTLDRWWSPGHEGSLILSNNARPMPTIMVERAEARAFETPWLSWLGPWRFNFGISQMEDDRQDIDRPLFLAWRVLVMPTRKIELGFTRTAQFCGEQLQCDLGVFWDLILGNDNVGIDTDLEGEPGNQMAGFDARWTSPLFNLPYAVYGQYIGEDESGYLPAKYLKQLGLEVWKPFADGALLQGYVEWAETDCSNQRASGEVNACLAYNQARFNVEGYRYYGRSIGYTADRNSENWALGVIFTASDASVWTGTARWSSLAEGQSGDTNTVATVPTEYGALEFGWKGRWLGQQVSVDLGVQSTEPEGAERDVEVFGFVSWRYHFGQ